MALFFLLVGLEMKRELLVGELASARQAMLPIAAAVGGMALPALVYTALTAGSEGARGWDFVSAGRGDVDFDAMIRALNRIAYAGPLSIEWEDSAMDREYGAQEALAFVRRTDFEPSALLPFAQLQRSET